MRCPQRLTWRLACSGLLAASLGCFTNPTPLAAQIDETVDPAIIHEIAEIRDRLKLSIAGLLPQSDDPLGRNEHRSIAHPGAFQHSLDRVIRRSHHHLGTWRWMRYVAEDQARRESDRPVRLHSFFEEQESRPWSGVHSAYASPAEMATVESLRQASRALDRRAADAEDANQFAEADRLRKLAESVRQEARAIVKGKSFSVTPHTAGRRARASY